MHLNIPQINITFTTIASNKIHTYIIHTSMHNFMFIIHLVIIYRVVQYTYVVIQLALLVSTPGWLAAGVQSFNVMKHVFATGLFDKDIGDAFFPRKT